MHRTYTSRDGSGTRTGDTGRFTQACPATDADLVGTPGEPRKAYSGPGSMGSDREERGGDVVAVGAPPGELVFAGKPDVVGAGYVRPC